ncbi:GntR family transcriptional regulator [Bradyrhizobium sp. R2.2-H]|jgi:DNA-binding GntR family transcriptional regulator|uniref:GntR family transcriptional regulator n=1 Tax=unclassified Bradyrhizobium TaxID=2631580 RepID=UPI001049ED8F|nr:MULTISPECIES: GntR family transcriptional regulator [unclassified Bradyrhizobium]TCU68356.1 GntR family transcriptional regulator [Bradyrhizobium sp. Y-H1]TCU70022.1 GntR family transcriptional regulator [Bradyrhizobium sp. R2.2-H]
MAAKTRPKSDAPDASDRVSRIREGVTAAILEHRLLPGTKLGEDEIGDIYGASRTLVRTALQQLAHEGIVNIEKNRGAFVARPTPVDAREVFEARRLIEPAIVDHAIDAASPAWLDRLQRHLAEEREAELRGDARASVRLSGEFHRLVAEMSGHSIYLGFLKELIARSSLIILLYRRHDTPACGTDHHARIVEAIGRRDGEAARALMLSHLQEIEAELFLKELGAVDWRLADVLLGA